MAILLDSVLEITNLRQKPVDFLSLSRRFINLMQDMMYDESIKTEADGDQIAFGVKIEGVM